MKPVDQTIVDVECGDCNRACLASILELPIDAVPNFIRFKSEWFFMMHDFLHRLGYDFVGTRFPDSHKLKDSPNVKGYVIASVPSKTFENITHSVVIALDGTVAHDPNPNKLWQGINVLETGDLKSWSLIEKVEKVENHARCIFSINEYDSDGDLSETGMYLHFGETKVKVAESKIGLKKFGNHISAIIKEIEENY